MKKAFIFRVFAEFQQLFAGLIEQFSAAIRKFKRKKTLHSGVEHDERKGEQTKIKRSSRNRVFCAVYRLC